MPRSVVRISLAIALASTLLAQSATPELDAPSLDAKGRAATVDAAIAMLEERYVFPEKAAECATLLRTRLQEGAYDAIVEPDAFARALTQDLHSVTVDKHLRIRQRRSGGAGRPRQRAPRPDADNFGFREVRILGGNVGYLDLRRFAPAEQAGDAATAAMRFLQNTDALVIDLRQNTGGSPTMIQLLCSYFFARPTHLNSFFWRGKEQIDQFWTLPHVPGKRRPERPMFVLTSGRTFSAAEEFTYDLQQLGRATIVGEVTGGGAHPGGLRPLDERFEMWVPQGRAINPISGTNWEGTGVVPDVEVAAGDALRRAHRLALDGLIENADSDADAERYRWHREGLAEPLTLPQQQLAAMARRFDGWQLDHEDGALWFQRDGATMRHRLELLAPNLLRFPDDAFRLRLDEADGQVVGSTMLTARGPVESARVLD